MTIRLTPEQSRAVAAGGAAVVLVDPATEQVYRLVRAEDYGTVPAPPYDDSPWAPHETALLAGQAFARLDDTDYSEYLGGAP